MTKQIQLGKFVSFNNLTAIEKEIVLGTWAVAENAYIPRSSFPVGAVILAQNDSGEVRSFAGCNVENRFFPATICAERNAATTAIAQGFRKFLKVAIVCKNYQGPGSSPCGLCRQVLTEFGMDGEVLGMADKQNNVYRFGIKELLPAAAGAAVPFASLGAEEKKLVQRLHKALNKGHVPYSNLPQAAICSATNAAGKRRSFVGLSDDNASYGGSALAPAVAMRCARAAGFKHDVHLALTVSNPLMHNPIEGECLQILREFGREAPVMLVGEDQSVVHTRLTELLPDSFGPESVVSA